MMKVSAEMAASRRWPETVAKNDASGVPKCGVFMVMTERKRRPQARGRGSPDTLTEGEAMRRASRPPVECPSR